MDKKFVFDGVHPGSVEGRFFKARVAISGKTKLLSIEEFKLGIRLRGAEKCPQLYAEYKIPLPDDTYKMPGQRILGNPICIGSHKQYILLQYITPNDPLIQFLMVDVERSLAQTCKMTCRHFLREYVLASPLECFLDTGIPICIIRLSPTMLRIHRGLAVQSVVFQTSKQLSSANISANALTIAETMIEFQDITSVKDTRFLSLIPLERTKFLLVTVDQFCIKFTFDTLDACTLASTKVASRKVLSNCSLLQCRACKTRSQDLICVACLTENREDDFTSARRLQVYIFKLPTYEHVTTYSYNCSKWFSAVKTSDSGEIMMTVSNCDTKVELWFAKRQCHLLFIKSFELCRPYVTSLKSQCRSTVLQYTNVWDIENLKLPKYLVQYLEYQ